ncbi:hypothetical protein [Amycolatopsis sp. NPDC050768]|uniref:hypothetical protein n=1 Tax=Amycolatopsis sp. NPDC050768 TaxID=3154839 RepID=UPI0033D5699F
MREKRKPDPERVLKAADLLDAADLLSARHEEGPSRKASAVARRPDPLDFTAGAPNVQLLTDITGHPAGEDDRWAGSVPVVTTLP